jgi:hypothetical protein
MTKYFNKPKQVVFENTHYREKFHTGIAYKDEIICLCCGKVFKTNNVEITDEYSTWQDLDEGY